MVNAKLVMQTQRMAREMRSPQHSFNVTFRPWQIQPVCLAPVLPGETLANAKIMSRVVTDPLQNKLIGWWCEFYLFYVKHRDMAAATTFQNMMLDAETDMSAVQATATDTFTYEHAGGVQWVSQSLNAVVDEYFRDRAAGHDSSDFVVGGLPLAKINERSWLDSVMHDSDYVVDNPEVVVGGDGLITGREIETALRQWEALQGLGMQNMTYEDYLETFGVKLPEEERVVPELLRYVRTFSYPSNTIDPTDGSAASAVSWSLDERAGKPRFFKEPGFVLGLMVTRPKVYRRTQIGSAACMLDSLYSWIPVMLNDQYRASVLGRTTSNGALGTTPGANYVWDTRDLFMYGDQFVNGSLADTDRNLVDLPTATLKRGFADSDDMNSVFVDNTGASGLNVIRADGIVSLNIKGRQASHDSTATIAGPTS